MVVFLANYLEARNKDSPDDDSPDEEPFESPYKQAIVFVSRDKIACSMCNFA